LLAENECFLKRGWAFFTDELVLVLWPAPTLKHKRFSFPSQFEGVNMAEPHRKEVRSGLVIAD